MAPSTVGESATERLRTALLKAEEDEQVREIIAAKDRVLSRYGQVFAPEHVPLLTEDEFKGFLLFDNNRHWTGLHRRGNSLCDEMPKLRKALEILVDESQPIRERLDRLIPKAAPRFMKKFGRAIVTAVLHVTRPDEYGVFNGTSEAGMKAVGVLPAFDRGCAVQLPVPGGQQDPARTGIRAPNRPLDAGRALVADEAQGGYQACQAPDL